MKEDNSKKSEKYQFAYQDVLHMFGITAVSGLPRYQQVNQSRILFKISFLKHRDTDWTLDTKTEDTKTEAISLA